MAGCTQLEEEEEEEAYWPRILCLLVGSQSNFFSQSSGKPRNQFFCFLLSVRQEPVLIYFFKTLILNCETSLGKV